MATEAAIQQQLKALGVTKAQMPEIIDAWKSDAREVASRARARLQSNRRSLSKVAVSSVAVTAGGAIAEPIRRDVVGRFTKGIRGQALGLLAARRGMLSAATAHLEHAVDTVPYNVDALRMLAQLYSRMGRSSDARARMAEAARFAPAP